MTPQRSILTALAMSFFSLTTAACKPPEADWIKPETIVLGCEGYQSIPVNGSILYNNVWNSGAAGDFEWSQCLEQMPGDDGEVYGWSWHWPNSGRQIFGYPQIKVGSSPWAPLPRTEHGLPARIGELQSLNVSHALDVNAAGNFNVATSMWLTNTPDIGDVQNPDVIAAEVMIWTYATDGHMDPAGSNVATIEHAGQRWSIWLDEDWSDASGVNDNSWTYITFKAESPVLEAEFDVVTLLRSDELGHLDLESLYIADVELGTEIMQGSGLVWVNGFTVEPVTR